MVMKRETIFCEAGQFKIILDKDETLCYLCNISPEEKLPTMALERNWLRFNGVPPQRLNNRIRVTINKHGYIHLSRTAYALFGKPKAVALYFEPELQRIALEHAEPRHEGAFPLVAKNHGAFDVVATPFCRHHRITLTGTEAFPRPDIDGGLMILDLRDTVRVGGFKKERHGT